MYIEPLIFNPYLKINNEYKKCTEGYIKTNNEYKKNKNGKLSSGRSFQHTFCSRRNFYKKNNLISNAAPMLK